MTALSPGVDVLSGILVGDVDHRVNHTPTVSKDVQEQSPWEHIGEYIGDQAVVWCLFDPAPTVAFAGEESV